MEVRSQKWKGWKKKKDLRLLLCILYRMASSFPTDFSVVWMFFQLSGRKGQCLIKWTANKAHRLLIMENVVVIMQTLCWIILHFNKSHYLAVFWIRSLLKSLPTLIYPSVHIEWNPWGYTINYRAPSSFKISFQITVSFFGNSLLFREQGPPNNLSRILRRPVHDSFLLWVL